MTSKHTPGPWEIGKNTNEKGDLYIWKAGNYFGDHAIATVHGEIQESGKANARLIASCPELLEACKEALLVLQSLPDWEEIEDVVGYTDNGEDSEPFTLHASNLLQQAIAKAEGEEVER